jgi:O-antigen/teichoic acid export membrane protein
MSIFNTKTGSRFRQNFIKVARANLIAQILPLLAMPLLTRLYSPSDFGAVALFTSSLSLLLAFSTWRFDWSVPNASTRTVASGLLFLGFIILLFFSLIFWVILWSAGLEWSFWNGFEILGSMLLFLPLAVIGGGLLQLLQSWYIREGDLTAIGRSKINQGIGSTSINIIGGIFGLGILGLIIGVVSSMWLGIITLVKYAQGLYGSLIKLSRKRLYAIGLIYGREATLSSAASLANAASLTVVPLLLAQYYSASEVGWYALMSRLAIAPVTLFTVALGQSFWSEAAILIKKDKTALKKLYLATTKRLAIASIPIILVSLLGPFYVGMLFGQEEWGGAGYILAALFPFLAGQIIISPLTHLIIHHKQHWQLLWNICRFALISSVIISLGTEKFDIALTVFILSIINFLMYGVIFYLNLKCYQQ